LFKVVTDPSDLFVVSNELVKRGYKLMEATTNFVADKENEVEFPEEYQKGFRKAMEGLENITEVEEYWTNIKED
jgi:transcriptional/translational regulatory protein YebC/TACO1